MSRKQLGENAWCSRQALYNLSCVYAKLGRDGEAMRYLEQLVKAGGLSELDMAHDPDLVSLHGKPAFEALLARLPASPH